MTHAIVSGNVSDDLFAVYSTFDGDFLRPNLQIQDFNIIGSIGNSVLDPGGSGHLYEVVSVPGGIDWPTANLLAGNGGPGSAIHLATPSTVEENDLVFNLVNDPMFWREFAVEQENAPANGTIQNIGPWLGAAQFDTMNEPALGWEWVTRPDLFPGTDDLFNDFNTVMPPVPPGGPNWAVGEPDNGTNLFDGTMPPDPLPQENRLAYFTPNSNMRANTWGDLPLIPPNEQLPIAFVLEYEPDVNNNMFGVDPLLLPLGDYGGVMDTFYPGPSSPAIDAGNSSLSFSPPVAPGEALSYEQRGRHFSRTAGFAIDIGATEVQQGIFRVDTLVDETDEQYSRVWENQGLLLGDVPFRYEQLGTTGGDFSLREALEFSEKNPEIDTITFEPILDPQILLTLDDPTTSSAAPTILLTLRSELSSALTVNHTVNIIGPEGFVVELDATGNDPTPNTPTNADGSRVFLIDDGNPLNNADVNISNLTLLGADVLDTGGAIKNLENLTLTNSTLKDNYASNDGGGIFSQIGNLIIDSSTLSGNRSGDDGGALFVDTGIPTGAPTTAIVRNSTVSGNTGVLGGGIYNRNGEVLVEFSTIAFNESTAAGAPFPVGGGIASLPGLDAITQVHSSIVSDNVGGDIELLSGATNIQSLGFNLIGDGNASVVFNQPGDMIGVLDPMLAPLSNTGGLVFTHRLLPGSPAIDAGDTFAMAGVGGVPLNDQRGTNFTRVFDGLQDTKDRIDIGAYEVQPTTFTVDTVADENDGDTSPGNFSLREAIEVANANPLTDTIMFSPLLLGGTITPSSAGLLPGTSVDMVITDSVNILGLGDSFLTLDGVLASDSLGNKVRLFTIDDGDMGTLIDVNISDLRFEDYFNTNQAGGVISSHENLTIERASFVNNSTLQRVAVPPPGVSYNGGAIYQRYGQLTLDNVTLSANSTDGVDADGGAIYVRDADLTIRNNSSISGNSTTQTLGSGGGIYLRGGTLNMSNSSITTNLAPGGEADGSGLFGYEAVLNIESSIISGNSMTGSNSEGAGIFSKDSALYLTNSVVSDNITTGTQSEGAGLYLSGGTAMIDGSAILRNSSTGMSSVGAGIAVTDDNQLQLHRSTIDLNSTTGIDASGGGIHNLSGQVVVRDSTISNNSVSGVGAVGGGVFSDGNLMGTQQTTLLNSTVSGNSSGLAGGGIYNADGLTLIQHSTITNNSVPLFGFGGGVASYGNASTRTDVQSTIISGNTISDVDRVTPGPTPTESFQSLGFNIIGTGLSTGAFGPGMGDQVGVTNAMLGPLVDNGGPTKTHALLDGSPAINAGDPLFAPFSFMPGLVTDQRGGIFHRIVDGQIDVGAFEVQPRADFNSDGFVSGTDFLIWMRGLGTLNAGKEDGDADGDNDVDAADLAIWRDEYGAGPIVVSATAAVAAAATAPPVEQNSGTTNSTTEAAPAVATVAVDHSPRLVGLASLTLPSQLEPDPSGYVDDSQIVSEVMVRDALLTAFQPASHDNDFGNIATSRPSTDDEDTFAGEDHFFDLLGSDTF
ncbi:MAG: hypothetical protein MI725_09875 [Pirellulales bacterium]|nr:hypothetical protein [Pirellulales bacterium]